VDVALLFDPRFDYARAATTVERRPRLLRARGGGRELSLACSREFGDGEGGEARWSLGEGETLWLRLCRDAGEDPECVAEASAQALAETTEAWRSWLRRRETGRSARLGHYQAMVDRSALALKLLAHEPAGTIAAAATTSLPECVGGVRNWDYRYTWVRDASFTLQALFSLGHLSETAGYLRWIGRLLAGRDAGRLQIMYGLRGEEELPEEELGHLEGYKGSRPVRVGNAAAAQRQHDIYGELLDAALRLSDYAGRVDVRLWPVLRDICDHVVGVWREPDNGIWEVRGGPRHFVHSKVMCWVALDRGLEIARRYGFPAELEPWARAAGEIRAEVLERGWCAAKGAFTQHYDTDELDASALLLPVLGFLPFDDPRVASTVAALERELGGDGFLRRYAADDGLPGGEGSFLLCSFWLVDCLVGLGRLAEAELLLRRLEGTANHLGLFAEEYDPAWREPLGNFPQAFTHIGYINSVTRLLAAQRAVRGEEAAEAPHPSWVRRQLARRVVLNGDAPGSARPPRELAAALKGAMNVLRGAFFDTPRSRVAYERMPGSDPYREYVALAGELGAMRLEELTGREERLAFWINLYNVLVIHAVVELGVRDSVREVRDFFRRVRYRVGGTTFSPHEIEHGILRGNRRPPHALRAVFAADDPRAAHAVSPPDPRVHFALVCASSSCPPIDVYTPEGIDAELDVSGRTFVNAGGVRIRRAERRVALSRIFRWYAADFGPAVPDLLRFVAPFLYRDEDRRFLEDHAEGLRVEYQPYDWRLNRG
jgi:hypothetical protein